MPRFNVIVEEVFVTRFTVDAETPDEAIEEAEALATDCEWRGSETLRCDRESYIEEAR